MKKILLVILALGLILAAVFTMLPEATSPVSAELNLILNPGFEEPGNVTYPPSDWVATGTSLGRSTDAYSGNFSANITGASSYYTQTVSVKPATSYQFWGHAKTTECAAYLSITIQDSGHGVVLTDYLSWNNTVWEKKSGDILTPSTAYYAVIKLEMTPEPGALNPEAWFDDIMMDEQVTIECFIATAAYGTSSAAEINTLRSFRDEVLLQNGLGSQLVELYYQTSPPVADFISENSLLRTIVRELLIDPVVSLVEATETLWRD